MIWEINDAQVVFHLAALIEAGESVLHPHHFVLTNITGSLNVLEAMRLNRIPTFIFSSTAAVYGEPNQTPITEDFLTRPINPYGATKLAMEAMLSSYVAVHGLTGSALRYFNLYGPEEHHQPETHECACIPSPLCAREPLLKYFSKPQQRPKLNVFPLLTSHPSSPLGL